jgi:hypothetical protein
MSKFLGNGTWICSGRVEVEVEAMTSGKLEGGQASMAFASAILYLQQTREWKQYLLACSYIPQLQPQVWMMDVRYVMDELHRKRTPPWRLSHSLIPS